MSIKVMTWAWAQDIEARDKLVLMALADHADDDGLCWPGIKGVAQKNRVSERAVQRHLASLQEAGLLEVLPQYRPDGGRTTNLYHLIMTPASPPGVNHPPPNDNGNLVNLASPPGEPGVTDLVNPASPLEPPSESPRNHHRTTKELPIDEPFRERMQQKYLGVLSDVGDRIDEALGAPNAQKWGNKQLYVQGWLRRDAERIAAQTGGRHGSSGVGVQSRGKSYEPKVGADGNVLLGK